VEAAAAATVCFSRGFNLDFDLAVVTALAADVPAVAGAILAAGELSTGWSDSASGVSGNQKSRSCQITMPKASKSRQREPAINLRCLGSWGFGESCRRA
jgi:hypothetical protein